MPTSFYIETFGCQMNERDSEIMTQLLCDSFQPVHQTEEADIVLVNTCSIREKAEHKAMSLLGQLRKLKSQKKSLVIGVVGCVAQQEGQKILDTLPFVDLVLGPQNIYNLPVFIEQIIAEQKRIVAIEQSPSFIIPPFLPDLQEGPPHKRFVTIMQGCNNFCTYCVVPFTRGREISRHHDDIIGEVEHLVQHGVQEITLLGQNVNSYGRDFSGKQPNFSALLHSVAAVAGLKRLRFTTSNPQDLTEELTRCFQELPVLCSHFHLPVQSGANTVLKKMNRKYTYESYMEKVELLRHYRPDIAITTDIIVGFPGETEKDFLETVRLVEEVRYHGAFSFKYSDRPQARSTAFDHKVSEEEKGRRLRFLQERINALVLERNQEMIGRTEEVMVEKENKGTLCQCHGRTSSNHIVHFTTDLSLALGQCVQVHIEEALAHSLRGSMVTAD